MTKLKSLSELPLHIMLLPGVLIVLVFCYYPMTGILIAFENFHPNKGFFQSEFVGLEHFEYLFQLPNFKQVLWNTTYIACMKIILGLIVPVIFALLLNEVRKAAFKRSVQTIVYLPHFLSWIILGGVLIDILSPSTGIVNRLLSWAGLSPVYFLGNEHWFPYVLVVTDIWKEFGFSTIVFLAAITSINPVLYEAALIDGANRWRQTWHVTLPGMLPIIVLMATLSLGNVLNAGFDQVFNLYSPQVYSTGDIIDTLVYRMGLVDMQYELATAIGLFKSVISLILITISYTLAYRLANYRIF
ncbi:sugar ABC transporter permease [Paenibacillus sp. 598K]|uniref:ABC transporter permease n=1 Tax=Paenibacillus sp. 598K TaxID=1117987 RepID=UPI000FF9EA2D|nr:ABC transporter permease subunit [Paenibacillus sp. 598K]GBF72943.1 sugar ABC transporter permease [Paenibacillus sp. 598K]